MKKAIVFGASGLVGSQLLELLMRDDTYDKVVVYSRREMDVDSDKVNQRIIHFDELEKCSDEISGDVLFCALGTTLKKAKTVQHFVKIDYELPLRIARIAKNNGIPSFIFISSTGANANSGNYYTRTKGRIERALQELQFENLKILRPSLLLGKRKEFRLGELLGKIGMGIFQFFLVGKLKKYRAIHAFDVARAMVILEQSESGKILYESNEIQDISDSHSK